MHWTFLAAGPFLSRDALRNSFVHSRLFVRTCTLIVPCLYLLFLAPRYPFAVHLAELMDCKVDVNVTSSNKGGLFSDKISGADLVCT